MLRRILIIASGGAVGSAMLALVSVRAGAIFGVGAKLDAYFVAVSLPSLLLSLSSSMVVAVLVPRLATLSPSVARIRAGEWALLGFMLAVPLAGLIAFQSQLIVSILAPGFSDHTARIASQVLQVMALTIPSTMAAFVYSAYGYASRRVWVGGASTAIYGIVWLGLLFIHPFTTSVKGLAFACLIATQVQLIFAFLLCAFAAEIPWPRWRLPHRLFPVLATITGVLIATTVSKINLLMDPVFGSFLPHGSVSELSYAARIALLLVAFTGQGSALTILGSGSRDFGLPADSRLLGVSIALLLSVGAGAAIAISFGPVATLLLAHGALTASKAATIGELVQAYSVLVVVQSLAWSMESTIYAERRVWIVARASIIALVVNIGLSAIFVWLLGIYGRPLAVTLAMTVYACLLMRIAGVEGERSLRSYLGALPWTDATKLLVLVAMICGTMLGLGRATSVNSSLLAVLSLGGATFATLAYVRSWARRAETKLMIKAARNASISRSSSVIV